MLFFGPDENTANLMDAGALRAKQRGYKYWKALTTGVQTSATSANKKERVSGPFVTIIRTLVTIIRTLVTIIRTVLSTFISYQQRCPCD